MKTQTLTVPVMRGDQATVTGEVVGPFLLHRPPSYGWSDGRTWHVTHIKTGMRFPWLFDTKTNARRFARLARKVTDWDRVECRRGDDPNNPHGVWVTRPTPEEREKIRNLAAALSQQQGGK